MKGAKYFCNNLIKTKKKSCFQKATYKGFANEKHSGVQSSQF